MACCARAYYHTLLFNLNMRSSVGLVMRDSQPSLGHISSALRTRDTLSSGPIQGTEIVELSCKFEFKQDYETGCAGEKVCYIARATANRLLTYAPIRPHTGRESQFAQSHPMI